MARRHIYLLGAGVGLVATWAFNLQFLAQPGGASLGAFVAAAYHNPASTSLTNDAVVVGLVFLFWSFFEARRLGMRRWWVYPLATAVAVAFAFPLFLYMRERALEEAAGGSGQA